MKTENIFEVLKKLEDIFNLSNLDENRKLFSVKNRNLLVSSK